MIDDGKEMSPDEREAAFQAWVESRPPAVRDVARRYPGARRGDLVCYRSTRNPRYHYTIHSYNETDPVTLTLAHGADSTLPGVKTFGQEPEQLIACDCGRWRWPNDDEIEATRRYLDAYSRLKYGRGLNEDG